MNKYLKSGQISHKAFQQQVIEVARAGGFDRIYFTWNSRHSPAGFPDLIMLKGSRMVVAELKTGKDKVRPEQQAWLDAFALVTPGVYVWRPSDSEDIDRILLRR